MSPEWKHRPPLCFRRPSYSFIPYTIAFELLSPTLAVRLRQSWTLRTTLPNAPTNQYNELDPREYNIYVFSSYSQALWFVVNPIAKANCEKEFTSGQFMSYAPSANALHSHLGYHRGRLRAELRLVCQKLSRSA